MVASTLSPAPRAGKILDILAIREIEAGCLCLKTDSGGHDREYKAVVEVQPLNFALLSEIEQEGILESFRTLLKRLSHDIMIHIRIERYDLQPYLHSLDRAAQDRDEALQTMAKDQKQFVLGLAASRALLQRKFYVVVPSEHKKAKNRKEQPATFDQARSQLDIRSIGVIEDLERAGLMARRLNNLELAQYYQSGVHRKQAEEFPLTPPAFSAVDRPIQPLKKALPSTNTIFEKLDMSNIIEEDDRKKENSKNKTDAYYPGIVKVSELLAPSAIKLEYNYVCVRSNVGDEYIRAFAAVGYPDELLAGHLDRLIEIDEPDIDVIMYISPVEATPYIRQQSRRLTGLKATQNLEKRHGRTTDPYIAAAVDQITELREKLVLRHEQVFAFALYILVRSSSKQELKERSSRFLSLMKSLDVTVSELTMEHHRAWLCGLPDARDLLRRRKVLDTSSLVMMFPFTSSSLSTPTGILTGIQTNGSLLILDPLSDQLENGHECKFARSGAGKSYDEKARIGRALLAGMDAISIDPDGEYSPLAKQYNGVVVRIAPGEFRLNPFDLPRSERGERNILEEKLQSLLVLASLLLGDGGSLNQREKSYLTRCFHHIYAEKGITADPATHSLRPPSMNDLYNLMRSPDSGDEFGLGDRLQRYVSSFPVESEIELEGKRLVVFSIRDLTTELRPVGLYLITEHVWNTVRSERRPRPRLLSIDEGWILGEYIANLARRARKYNLCLRFITQDVVECLESEWGRILVVNSALKFLMKQDASTIDVVVRAFHLSDGERKYLLSCNKGEGLYFARNSHVPLRVVVSELEHSFATTNVEEQRRIAQEEQDHEQDTAKTRAVALTTDTAHHYDVVMPSYFSASASKNGQEG